MKKIIIIFILLIITGCNYTELNDLSIIKSIGIEYVDNNYIIYAEIIDKIDKENIPKTKILEVKSNKISECFNKLIILSNKSIHYSHIDLLILSPNLNNQNIKEIFAYFLNNQNFRNDFQVIGSNNIKTLIENCEYDEIEQLLDNNQHKKLINIDIENIIKLYLEKKEFKLSIFEYENENIIYKNNLVYLRKDIS